MDAGQILLIVIAIVAANLPFVSERIFFVIPSRSVKASADEQGESSADEDAQQQQTASRNEKKHFGWRVLELVALYFIVGGGAYLLENRLAKPHEQSWQFYAITACLFLVFAYPGFVAKYLWNARGR